MKKILLVKTHYPHWGQHTAFNAMPAYFDRQQFKIEMRGVPMADRRSRLPASLFEKYVHKRFAKKGAGAYGFWDLAAEISIFFNSLFSKKLDIIHLVDAEHALYFLPRWFKRWAFLKTFPRIIAMFHQPPALLSSLAARDALQLVDCVLVVAPVQAAYFEQFIPKEKIHTILLGVDTVHFRPAEGEKDSRRFMCLAGGVWLRDYGALIRTAQILQDHREIEFHVVAPKLDIPDGLTNITLHKNIPDDELYRLYRTCHVLFLPLQDATANTFLLEGAACGLPIVSSALASIKTYFPGSEAILAADNDAQTFAGAILELANDRAKLAAMSASARKRAEELSWGNIVKQYEHLYTNL